MKGGGGGVKHKKHNFKDQIFRSLELTANAMNENRICTWREATIQNTNLFNSLAAFVDLYCFTRQVGQENTMDIG